MASFRIRNCSFCGKSFQPTGGNGTFCSLQCAFLHTYASIIPDENGCMNWPKHRTRAGYGTIFANKERIYAHRMALELKSGILSVDVCACHHCDNPSCCNPLHLFEGTHKENMQDSKAKGRNRSKSPFGSAHPLAKLSEDNVRFIRENYRRGKSGERSETSVKGLAKKFNVAHSLIHRIVTGKSWPQKT